MAFKPYYTLISTTLNQALVSLKSDRLINFNFNNFIVDIEGLKLDFNFNIFIIDIKGLKGQNINS